jgi:hypothetical protein
MTREKAGFSAAIIEKEVRPRYTESYGFLQITAAFC